MERSKLILFIMGKLGFILISVTLSVATVFTTSCSKEQGCTDPDSKNYSETAEEDDGSCNYEGGAVFWYNETTAQGLVNDGAISLTYYVDGKIVGSSASNVFWTGTEAPDCGQNGSVTVVKNLGHVKTQAYSYSVIDQRDWEYWGGIINFNANTCTAVKLNWSKKKKK